MTAPAHITLIGFMASGKSTVARLIATRLGWQALDSDDVIESAQGRTIARIFEDDGELAFRRLEAATFEELRSRDDVVVGGGGASSRELYRTRRLQP